MTLGCRKSWIDCEYNFSYEAKISYQLLFKLWYLRLTDVPSFTKLLIIHFLGVDLTLFVIVINAIV